jgi:methylenetetrahydrofolate dehydrogenase (NADP+) / methenyltetrahydrofolate cyclohydrolase
MEKILSGKPISAKIRKVIRELIATHGLTPKMRLIQVGSDPASDFYVQSIVKRGGKLGCEVDLLSLPEGAGQNELLEHITAANEDDSVHGIMVQKPLPKHIDDSKIGSGISPDKDIDCLNPVNLGKIILQEDSLLPATPFAVLCTLKHYKAGVQGSHALIIGRSNIVGKPLANILLWKKSYANASVTVCHSRSENMADLLRSADIVIAALGKAEFVTADMVKEKSILIDVGINEKTDAAGKTSYVGDVDYNSCFDKALAITPVPGGIGSVTTSLLFLNLCKACLASGGINKSVDDFLALIFND